MRRIDRYALTEILRPLGASLAALYLLLFMMVLLRGATVLLGSAVTPLDLGRFMLFLTPHFLQQALPAALLVAVLLGIGRLAEDGELSAMASLGLSPTQLLRGPLSLALGLGGLSLLLAVSLQPWGLAAVRAQGRDVIKRNLAGDVKPGVFHSEVGAVVFYAEQVDAKSRAWRRVLVSDERDPSQPLLLLAQEGRTEPTSESQAFVLELARGALHRPGRAPEEYAVVEFGRARLAIDIGDLLYSRNRFGSPREELTPGQLLREADAARSRGESGLFQMVAYHRRFAQAFTPLAFALVATPLALAGRRARRARGYVLTLACYVAYYLVTRAATAAGEGGSMPAWVSAHLPNLLFAAGGGLLLAWSVRKAVVA